MPRESWLKNDRVYKLQTSRKQIAAAFTLAKRGLAKSHREIMNEEGEEFICRALDHLWQTAAAEDAKHIIKTRFGLSNYGTIYAWLDDVAKIDPELLTNDNVQAYKHRWLDSVIKEFNA